MRLLLDTHAFIWLHDDPQRLGSAMAIIRDPVNELLVSAVVAWEIAIKASVGRLLLPEPVGTWLPSRMARIRAAPLAIQHEHALAVADLPPLHRDPFDRLLVCQSRLLRAPIVTADRAIIQYDVDVIEPAAG